MAELQPGQSRRDDVAAVLGTPTSVGTFDPNVWYYIGQKTEKTAFFEPEVTERRVVVAHFDNNGVLREIKTLDKSNGQDIDLVERTTPTAGREMGFLEQMMGNVGRFSAKDTKGKGPGS
ncbi:outer membrane protein assembly factor BamE [Azospirillum sp. TSH100]|uniref:outer membrane protein assembly factor BamE n=1 Tax=Azospirillum sp. TSH100 TaxID=652764 RepID=UPI001FFF52DD|nr:outer membrane protein assembly factor BamE [Azospirillum sp. TSH100]